MAVRNLKKRPKDCYIICENFERKGKSKICISLAVISKKLDVLSLNNLFSFTLFLYVKVRANLWEYENNLK